MNARQRLLSISSWLAPLAILLALFARAAVAQQAAQPTPTGARVVELRIEDVIQPIVAEHVGEAFDQAARDKASLILITMNTPGGLDSSMRDIIHRIITSPVPVCVYVSPTGRRAASAGFFILLSADIAAMAPGTDTGAASPIFSFGGQSVQIDETLRKKVVNEAAAYLRTITEKRGRNVALAEKAVTEAKAFTEKEALEGKLIDLVAPSVEDLLAQLNGREIRRFDGTMAKLELSSPVRSLFEMNTRQRILSRIAQPDILFVLIVVALLGLYVEFSNPGLIFPGVIGALALITVLIASQILPISALGVLLILAAVVLFILEAKFTSHGLLGLAGAACMIAGAMMLVRSPLTGWGVSPWTALIVTLPFALITIFLMRKVLQTFRWRPATGAEQLVGTVGEITDTVETPAAEGMLRGMAFIQGELWRVKASTPLPKGTHVRVKKVDGLTLHVEPDSAAKKEK
jgi:membrane-bound serine protease (ClpP class)